MTTTVQTEKVGRNDPCPCGKGKKFKKCCGFNTPVLSTAPVALSPEEQIEQDRRKLDEQLAKFAPNITVQEVETKIREALTGTAKTAPMKVIEAIFSDDNLNLNNKRQADRLFRAFMSLWNTIAANEKNQTPAT